MAQTGIDDANSDHIASLLQGLMKRKDVQAAIILDKNTGTILKTTGEISFSNVSANRPSSVNLNDSSKDSDEVNGIEVAAAMVFTFVQAAGALIQGLDPSDEAKLLRLRTKKFELVIVPDLRYLLVVIHETTPAA